jgi:hypothetical protein
MQQIIYPPYRRRIGVDFVGGTENARVHCLTSGKGKLSLPYSRTEILVTTTNETRWTGSESQDINPTAPKLHILLRPAL